MRRALLLGAATALVAAAGVFAVAMPGPTAEPREPHITRLFIPAIKDDCRLRNKISDAKAPDIGYTFLPSGALTTIDQDGEFTGIESERLAAFNRCLAQYPIDPIRETPHDHYSRNLLYDYFSTTLQPCLAGRFDDLPPLPNRADFVVRIYLWDPYRVLAPRLKLDELLQLSTDCPELPPYLMDSAAGSGVDQTMHPMTSPEQAVCFHLAGLITDPSESWSVVGLYLNVYSAEGKVVAALNTQVTGTITGRSILNCLHGVP
jgi:hypothetical protein